MHFFEIKCVLTQIFLTHYFCITNYLYNILKINMSFFKRVLPPLFFGAGVGLILYGSKGDLPIQAYLANIPFWPLVVMPSGLLWKKVIKT